MRTVLVGGVDFGHESTSRILEGFVAVGGLVELGKGIG
jgi:hypothetical protein